MSNQIEAVDIGLGVSRNDPDHVKTWPRYCCRDRLTLARRASRGRTLLSAECFTRLNPTEILFNLPMDCLRLEVTCHNQDRVRWTITSPEPFFNVCERNRVDPINRSQRMPSVWIVGRINATPQQVFRGNIGGIIIAGDLLFDFTPRLVHFLF